MAEQKGKKGKGQPRQQQSRRPGLESEMTPRPKSQDDQHKGTGKLKNKVAIITGGDSGIGRAVALAFAREGADVLISYLSEDEDAEETRRLVEDAGRKAVVVPGDVGDREHCEGLVAKAMDEFGRLDVLVNNAAYQMSHDSLPEHPPEEIERIFRTNILHMFWLCRAAIPHLKPGASIITTSSIQAYEPSPQLLPYSSTKGAIVAFTRSLSMSLADKGIRVNGVAPGPIWTPLIPSTFPPDKVASFGSDTPLGRAGEPAEIAPSFVFLASSDASYFTGQVLHPNGGEVVNG